jgi:hypothetical protein
MLVKVRDLDILNNIEVTIYSPEHLRTGCDLMQVFFVLDEYSDVEETAKVVEMVDIIKDALHNPDKPRPANEILLGELARQ